MEFVKRGRWRYILALCANCKDTSKEVRVDQWRRKNCAWVCLSCAKKNNYIKNPEIKTAIGKANRTHGESKNKHSNGHWLYERWQKMKRRCKHWPTYVAKKIRVCPEWETSYMAFKKWAEANGAEKNLELDRIDNFDDYSPENCRWVTHQVNCQNR